VKTKIKPEDSDSSEHETNDEEEGDSSDVDSNQSSDLDDGAPIGKSKKYKEQPLQCDVNEGCTVFLKNVPFTATNEELKQCMLKFGPIIYALICIDPLTEHSKGTAFVKFQVYFIFRIQCQNQS
jgi:nucleolar protein 4